MLADLRLNQLAEVRLEPLMRPLLIRAHQARVPRHVGGEDRGEAADSGHELSGRSIGLTEFTSKPARTLAFQGPATCLHLNPTPAAVVHIPVVLRRIGRVWGLGAAGYP
jgi:hypothetical protein